MTVAEIAKMAKCSKRAVQGACRRAGYKPKFIRTNDGQGRNFGTYDLTDRQVKELIDKHLHFKRGRPAKEKTLK